MAIPDLRTCLKTSDVFIPRMFGRICYFPLLQSKRREVKTLFCTFTWKRKLNKKVVRPGPILSVCRKHIMCIVSFRNCEVRISIKKYIFDSCHTFLNENKLSSLLLNVCNVKSGKQDNDGRSWHRVNCYVYWCLLLRSHYGRITGRSD